MTESYKCGYARALVELKQLLQGRSEALNRNKLIRKKDNRIICKIIDEMISKREVILYKGVENLDVYEKDGEIMIKDVT